MDADLERIREQIRSKKNKEDKKNKKSKKNIYFYVVKILIVIILTFITLILLKNNDKLKTDFYKYVYNNNFSFTSVNNLYQKYFGSPIPFKNFFEDNTKPVFNEKLNFKETNVYKDGVELKVDTNYMVPAMVGGLVVFVGDKDEYKDTVIIQGQDGIDIWYSNVSVNNLNLYDYIEKGSLIGETKGGSLYLVFKKDGKVLDYKEYIN